MIFTNCIPRFKSVFRTTPADLACYKNRLEHPKEPCCLVVDCGFSFTHVVPFVHGRRVNDAGMFLKFFIFIVTSVIKNKRKGKLILISSVRRIDVGGKLLTNHLKEIISYRQVIKLSIMPDI